MTRRLYNFIRGAGSLVDLMPAPTAAVLTSPAFDRTDEEALRSDWQAVGDDLRMAFAAESHVQTQSSNAGDPAKTAAP